MMVGIKIKKGQDIFHRRPMNFIEFPEIGHIINIGEEFFEVINIIHSEISCIMPKTLLLQKVEL